MKEIFSEVNKITDAYRTAPLGETVTVLALGIIFANYDRPVVSLLGIPLAVLGIYLTGKMNHRFLPNF